MCAGFFPCLTLIHAPLGFAIHTYNLSQKCRQVKDKLKKFFFSLNPNFSGKLILEVSCGFVGHVQINVHCSAVNIKGTVKKESLCMG